MASMQRSQVLFRHPLMRRLAVAERMLVEQELRACVGQHGLQIDVFQHDTVPVLPCLGHWARLSWQDQYCHGDVHTAAGNALPFADESFDVIWLKHVFDRRAEDTDWLAEAIRLLAPGGYLLISGVHPCGGWAPWSWLAAYGDVRLRLPGWLKIALGVSGLAVTAQWRQASCWPSMTAELARRQRLGGIYMLLARKQRAQILPFVSRLAASYRQPVTQLGIARVEAAASSRDSS